VIARLKRTSGFGAPRTSAETSPKVGSLNQQPTLSFADGNAQECPIPLNKSVFE
jgi:hypothetical protein